MVLLFVLPGFAAYGAILCTVIRDLTSYKPSAGASYDVCIIGSGPAGIVVAAELSQKGAHVCVLESGEEEPSAEANELRALDNEGGGLSIREGSRERRVGGATAAWWGLSAPLDAIDYEGRPWVPSRWPFNGDDLRREFERLAEAYYFPRLSEFSVPKGGAFSESDSVSEKAFIRGRITRFGETFKGVFENTNADLFTRATATAIVSEKGTVQRVMCRDGNGEEKSIRARFFVLAAGGIENARLLLISDNLGNEHDQVGRYFMDHPKCVLGTIRDVPPDADLAKYFGVQKGDTETYVGLRLPEEIQRTGGFLNAYVKLEPLFPWTESKALRTLRGASAGVRASFSKSAPGGATRRIGAFVQHAFALFSALPEAFRLAALRAFHRGGPKAVRVRAYLEMNPDPENRITLSPRSDRNGVPLPKIKLVLGEREYETLRAIASSLADEVRRKRLGVFFAEPEETLRAAMTDASHHIGATRIGDNPAFSVVDADLKVHSVDNLYIAGNSVFPTGGCANPTYVICALSVRLAGRLSELLGLPKRK